MLLTDNQNLIRAAKKNYERFLVPTSMVDAKKVVRYYTKAEQADLDIKTSVNKIGEIVNLSQELNTKFWDAVNNGAIFEDVAELYYDITKLDILSGLEIDKAKKEFAVDSVAEIKKLKKKYEERDERNRQIKPNFFGKIARMKGYYDSKHKNYQFHDTTMDYIQHCVNTFRTGYNRREFLPLSALLADNPDYSSRAVRYPQVARILELVRNMRTQIRAIWADSNSGLENSEKAVLVDNIRVEYYRYIKTIQMSDHTAHRLLLAIEAPENKDISRSLFYMLFSVPNKSFLRLLQERRESVPILQEVSDGSGDMRIYDFELRKTFGNHEADAENIQKIGF